MPGPKSSKGSKRGMREQNHLPPLLWLIGTDILGTWLKATCTRESQRRDPLGGREPTWAPWCKDPMHFINAELASPVPDSGLSSAPALAFPAILIVMATGQIPISQMRRQRLRVAEVAFRFLSQCSEPCNWSQDLLPLVNLPWAVQKPGT